MKQSLFLLLAVLTILPAQAQRTRRPRIKGSKMVAERFENLPPFDGVKLRNDLKVKLRKSLEPGYDLQADDNLLDIIKFEVVDGTLEISSYYDIRSARRLDITVRHSGLTRIQVLDGELGSDEILSSERMRLEVEGDGKLDLDINAPTTQIEAKGTGRVDLNLDCDLLDIKVRQRADVRMYAVGDQTDIALDEDGDLQLQGSMKTLNARLLRKAKLRAEKLEAADVDLTVDGSAQARVQAYDNFALEASGSTKTQLYGNPAIIIRKFLERAQLHKKPLETDTANPENGER